jgi:hypothetical protein
LNPFADLRSSGLAIRLNFRLHIPFLPSLRQGPLTTAIICW